MIGCKQIFTLLAFGLWLLPLQNCFADKLIDLNAAFSICDHPNDTEFTHGYLAIAGPGNGAGVFGHSYVVFSTEPETVLSLADRVLVMRKGEIAHEFAGEAISKDRLLAAA